ncbi:hypothetical protein O181_064357 [Austropuccinia psidii MF-1]|uniref:BED-type domain-containing protein n=1 Tax=Austropuccinia psidii MF-1 TaxID=1389203 RepID=A0A9Q3EVM2_9BASI|nr:hypothetical protein [Austropuccinia psidii MF-1]
MEINKNTTLTAELLNPKYSKEIFCTLDVPAERSRMIIEFLCPECTGMKAKNNESQCAPNSPDHQSDPDKLDILHHLNKVPMESTQVFTGSDEDEELNYLQNLHPVGKVFSHLSLFPPSTSFFLCYGYYPASLPIRKFPTTITMSSAAVSRASSPSEVAATTQASLSEAPTNPKRSWVWLYFTDLTNGSVECQVANKSGTLCQKRLKRDRTGSTKSMSDHLNALHCLTNPSRSLQVVAHLINILKMSDPSRLFPQKR